MIGAAREDIVAGKNMMIPVMVAMGRLVVIRIKVMLVF